MRLKKLDLKKIFLFDHINNARCISNRIKINCKNRGIKGYNNSDKDELLKTILLSALSLDELRSISRFKKINNYENMSEDELLNAFKDLKPFKDGKDIRKENQNDDEIMRDLRFLYEQEENYYERRKTKSAFGGNYLEYESNGDTSEVLSTEDYLNKIRPYLSDIIDKHEDEWKIQLAAEITFSGVGEKNSKDFYPIYMHSENLKVYIGSETNFI